MVTDSEGYIHIIEYLTEHLNLFESHPVDVKDNAITVMMEIEAQLSEQIISVCMQNELLTSSQRNTIIHEIDIIASDLGEVFSNVANNPISLEQQAFIHCNTSLIYLVPEAGLEPARTRRKILSLLCLPFHHSGFVWYLVGELNSRIHRVRMAFYH